MANYNDLKRDFFNANSTGTFTNVYDAERNALLQKTSSTSGNTVDLWKKYFAALGYDAYNLHISDVWYAYLGSKGYTGSLRDRKKLYYAAGVME